MQSIFILFYLDYVLFMLYRFFSFISIVVKCSIFDIKSTFFLYIILNIKFIIWYSLLGMSKKYAIPISCIYISKQNLINSSQECAENPSTCRVGSVFKAWQVGLAYKKKFYSGLGWVWVIKLQTRQTRPDPPIFNIYLIIFFKTSCI